MGARFAALLADRFGNLVRATQIEEREAVLLTHSIREQVIWLRAKVQELRELLINFQFQSDYRTPGERAALRLGISPART